MGLEVKWFLRIIMVKLKLKNCQLLLDLFTYTYVVYQLMYENVYGKTPPRFGENDVTLALEVDRPCFNYKLSIHSIYFV